MGESASREKKSSPSTRNMWRCPTWMYFKEEAVVPIIIPGMLVTEMKWKGFGSGTRRQMIRMKRRLLAKLWCFTSNLMVEISLKRMRKGGILSMTLSPVVKFLKHYVKTKTQINGKLKDNVF